ncbi:MAG: VanZ family protein [Candidatus Ventricola sp.]
MSVAASILSFILVAALGVALIQAMNALFAQERQFDRWHYHRDLLLMDAVLLAMYLMLAALIIYLYVAFAYEPLVLLCAAALLAAVSVATLARYVWRLRAYFQSGQLAALGVWFGVALYLTMFSRMGGGVDSQSVMTPFRGVTAALEQQSLRPLSHALLNVLLFVPFGFLIPGSNPRAFSRAGFAILGGLVTSTVIEGAQMALGLGVCDIDDVIANALGAALGYVAYCLWAQMKKNWRMG